MFDASDLATPIGVACWDAHCTEAVPPFPALVIRLPAPREHVELEPGNNLGDFEIVRRLGRGAAGTVYLARQISLDRHVALKITPNVGGEARAMAILEHPNIVQVYSQTIVPEDNARHLCMQYVPGATIADLIVHIKETPAHAIVWAVFNRRA